MYAKHGNLVDADASGAKASTKHCSHVQRSFKVTHDDGLRITVILILHLSEILQVFALVTPPYSTLTLRVFPLHHVGVSRSINLKLISREINFEVFQRSNPTYVITVPERYRRTERFGRSRSSKVIDFGTIESACATSHLSVLVNYRSYLAVAPFRRYCRFFVLLSDSTHIPP